MPPNHPFIKSLALMCLIFLVTSGAVMGQRIDPSVNTTASFDWSAQMASGTFSIGEVAITTLSGPSGSVTQGFLQPEVSVPCSEFTLNYFPNPVRSVVTIRDSACGKTVSTIEVFDTFGRWVDEVELDNRQANLELLTPGVYLVRAYGTTREFLGAFKIMKVGGDEG